VQGIGSRLGGRLSSTSSSSSSSNSSSRGRRRNGAQLSRDGAETGDGHTVSANGRGKVDWEGVPEGGVSRIPSVEAERVPLAV
jgi:hypothetical protein